MVARGDTIEVSVGAPGHGGFCVARHEGQAVFVRHALPGERVLARVTEVRPSYLRADAIDILQASEDRVPPPCPHAGPGKCGGCDWQHASLAAQRRLKAEVVTEQFRRLAGLELGISVEAVAGDDHGLGWRTRVGYSVDTRGRAGLRRHRSHDVHPIDTCLIAHPELRRLGVPGLTWPGVASVEAIVSSQGERAILAEPRRGQRVHPDHPDDDVTVARRQGRAIVVMRGAPAVTENAGGRDWHLGLDTFWQTHPGAAETLLESVVVAADVRPGERILDLYAGAGLFAGVLAVRAGPAGRVIAVESGIGAAADADVNLAWLPQAEVRAQVVAEGAVTGLVAELGGVDVVVLDPPRAGAGAAVVEEIAAAGPRVVVYVACDPASLARDVRAFLDAGYVLDTLAAYDLYPMTAHVECVAVLRPTAAPAATV